MDNLVQLLNTFVAIQDNPTAIIAFVACFTVGVMALTFWIAMRVVLAMLKQSKESKA